MPIFRHSFLFFPLVFLFLVGCASRQGGEISEQASAVRQAYRQYVAEKALHSEPYRLHASLRMGEQGKTRRVTMLLWGNGKDTDETVRLDVMAGMGSMVLRLRENQNEFVAFNPNEATAWLAQGRGQVLIRLAGTTFPFGLRKLTALLQGNFQDVFGMLDSPAQLSPENNVLFDLSDSELQGQVELRADGLPIRWIENGEQGWDMHLEYEETNSLPELHKITLQHASGHSAILLMKQWDRLDTAFTKEQLALPLPSGTVIKKIRRAVSTQKG